MGSPVYGLIKVELNSGSYISKRRGACGLDVKHPRFLILCIGRTPDLSVKIRVKRCVLYTVYGKSGMQGEMQTEEGKCDKLLP